MSLDDWTWRNPVPQGNPLDGVAYGNGTFVAVSRAGTIMRSTDVIDWTIEDLGYGFSAVRFINNTFVAVGSFGKIFTSSDGVTWYPQVSGTSHALLDVAYGNGKFVAVGQCDAITSSPDGITWTAQSSGITGKENEKFYGIAYGNGLYVAVGLHGTVLTSADGTLWNDKSRPARDDLVGIAFGGGYFVAIHNTGESLRSIDGNSWDTRTVTGATSVDYVNGRFVATGETIVGEDRVGTISTSTDGLTWAEQTSHTSEVLFGTAYGNNTYLIGGYDGTILTSADAVQWTPGNSHSDGFLSSIAYGNGTFIAVGSCNPDAHGQARRPKMFSSSDLVTWTEVNSPAYGPLEDVMYTGNASTAGGFVAVGGYGSVLTSDDGSDWHLHSVQSGLLAVTAHNSTLVAVGTGGRVYRSTDRATWPPISTGTNKTLQSVAYGSACFVAVGDDGTIVMSEDDGRTWKPLQSGTTENLRGVAFNGHRFVAVALSGEVLISIDGRNWIPRVTCLGTTIYSVRYLAQIPGFVALGEGCIWTSPDGESWTPRHSGTSNNLSGCCYGNGSFFVTGQACAILQSEVSAPLFVSRPLPSVRSPQKAGSQVTWHCRASGKPGLRYVFTLTKLTNTPGPRPPRSPHAKPAIQTSPSITYPLNSPGTYVVTVQVREPNGTVIKRDSPPFVVT